MLVHISIKMRFFFYQNASILIKMDRPRISENAHVSTAVYKKALGSGQPLRIILKYWGIHPPQEEGGTHDMRPASPSPPRIIFKYLE